jgi:hypothetical protein
VKRLILTLSLLMASGLTATEACEANMKLKCLEYGRASIVGTITNPSNHTHYAWLHYIGIDKDGDQVGGTDVFVIETILPKGRVKVIGRGPQFSCDTIKSFALLEDRSSY